VRRVLFNLRWVVYEGRPNRLLFWAWLFLLFLNLRWLLLTLPSLHLRVDFLSELVGFFTD